MLTGLGRGLVLEGIARTLNISIWTASTHEKRAREKLRALTRSHAVAIHARIHGSCRKSGDTPGATARPGHAE